MHFSRNIAVIGLGYVGIQVAAGFAARFPGTIGFDIDETRVNSLRDGHDATGTFDQHQLEASKLFLTSDPKRLRSSDVFIVCVPTPVHYDHRPNLGPLISASETVGKIIRPGAVVIFESTVYPGTTEDICGPEIARVSGLVQGRDFKLGYSPERINPGDREHHFANIVKVVAGEDEETTRLVTELYSAVVPVGVHVAPSIKAAETAKALENTQRDLNVALMNELAIICDLIGIRTRDVLDAARTKWNFLDFSPGFVGGHCIGVDPYYLMAKAQSLGYHPEVIHAGRRINDSMGTRVAHRVVRLMGNGSSPLAEARVGIMGITFKENVSDIRNSRMPDLIAELSKFGIAAAVCDPLADPEAVKHEYGIELAAPDGMRDLDALVLAVPHREFLAKLPALFGRLAPGGVLIDIKSVVDPNDLPAGLRYWSL